MSDHKFQVIGETVYAACASGADDQAAVSLVGEGGRPEAALLEICLHVDDADEYVELSQVLLAPADARRIAAALLNAADRIDGTVALVFYERPPEVGE